MRPSLPIGRVSKGRASFRELGGHDRLGLLELLAGFVLASQQAAQAMDWTRDVQASNTGSAVGPPSLLTPRRRSRACSYRPER